MSQDPRSRAAATPAERIAQLALARGYLSPEQLQEARQAGGDLLQLLAARYLRPEHVQELRRVYAQQTSGSGRVLSRSGHGSDDAPTIQRPPPSSSGATHFAPPPGIGSDSAGTIPHAPPADPGLTGADSAPTQLGPGSAPTGSAAPPAGGGVERVGPYEIVRELARGGMGVVYVARRAGLDREVAVKVLLPGGDLSVDTVKRFLIEANVAARLRHPNIVGIHDVGKDGGRHYFAMDLIQGESLQDRLRRDGPLELRTAARLAARLAGALAYSHRRAVLHRDIKPHNVLIDEAGEPLLTDYGLAKDVGEQDGLTQTGQVMGTPAYMPPEQANGDIDRIDRRTDVYSLGATLYQMLTGRPPFEGTSALNLIKKVLTDDPDSPRKLRAEVPADLNTICLKCLEKEPEDRYPTAQALQDDLERFLGGHAIEARPPSLVERVLKWRQRNRAVAAVGAVALLLLVVGSGVATLQVSRAADSARQGLIAESRQQEQKAWSEHEAAWSEVAETDWAQVPQAKRGERLEASIRTARGAFMAAQRLDAVDPAPTAREALLRAGLALGRSATLAGRWDDAEQTYARLAELKVSAGEFAEDLGRLEEARRAEQKRREAEILGLIEAVRRGAREPNEAAFAVVKYAEPATVALLAAELDEASRVLAQTAQEFYSELARPTREEAEAGERAIDLEPVLERWLGRAQLPSTLDQAVLRSAEARKVLRVAAKRKRELKYKITAPEKLSGRALLATLQEHALAERAKVVDLAVIVLANLGISRGVVGPLRRYFVLAADRRRVNDVAVALCGLMPADEVRDLLQRGVLHHGRFLPPVRRAFLRAHPNAGELFEEGSAGANGLLAQARSAAAAWEWQEALDLLERVEEVAPGHLDAWVLQARIRINLRQAFEAGQAAQRALDLDPSYPPALTVGAHAQLLHGKVDEAQELLGRALELDPELGRGWLLRGVIDHLLGNQREALEAFSQAIRLEPELAEAWGRRAKTQLMLGDPEAALADYERAVALQPQNPEWHARRGRTRLWLGDPEGARADVEAAMSMRFGPRSPVVRRARATLRYASKDYEGVVDDLSVAIQFDPTDVEALLQRAIAYTHLGRFNDALRDFDAHLELTPDSARALANRAYARMSADMDDVERAHADCVRAIEIDPQLALAWRYRSLIRKEMGNMQGAIDDALELVRLQPQDMTGWLVLAFQQAQVERYQDALATCDKALGLNPGWYQMRRPRADALAGLGRQKEGEAELQAWLREAPPNDPDRAVVEALLAE